MTDDGRYFVFVSPAVNFDPRANGLDQVYLRDREADTLELITVGTDDSGGNGPSANLQITPDGRFIVFESQATNLLPGVNLVPNLSRIYLWDLTTRTMELVSRAADGNIGNSYSYNPAMSADGRYVAFASDATNLVSGDRNGQTDVFLRDRLAGTTTRVNVRLDGAEANNPSGRELSISGDGHYVAFESRATNLVPGDTIALPEIFLYNRLDESVTRAVVTVDGGEPRGTSSGPSLSDDGRYLAFSNDVDHLVSPEPPFGQNVYVRDLVAGQTEVVSVPRPGSAARYGWTGSHAPSISPDGRYVAFSSTDSDLVAGDTNGLQDAFIRDRQLGVTTRVSLSGSGSQPDDDASAFGLSADGRYIGVLSRASNLTAGDLNGADDVFVRDQASQTTERVSLAPGGGVGLGPSVSQSPNLSADGHFVCFVSDAVNLVTNDHNGTDDVFVWNRLTGVTERVSLSTSGEEQLPGPESSGSIRGIVMSGDGRFVAFISVASNLVQGDTNGKPDVFVHDRQLHTTERINLTTTGQQAAGGCDPGGRIAISRDGRFIAFASTSPDMAPGVTSQQSHAYVYDRKLASTQLVDVAMNSSPSGIGIEGYTPVTLSPDGRYVGFSSWDPNLVPGDTNRQPDLFIRDRIYGVNERVNLTASGTQSSFGAEFGLMSADNRYVAFLAGDGDLVAGDTNHAMDAFLRDRAAKTTSWISKSAHPDGWPFGDVTAHAISADGQFAAFDSSRSDLVSGDTNFTSDVFVRNLKTNDIERVNLGPGGAQSDRSVNMTSGAINGDGQFVVFASDSTTLLPGHMAGSWDVYLRDRSISLYPPQAPSDLTAAFQTTGAIQLTWLDRSTNEQGFKIERAEGSGSFLEIGSVGANVVTYTSSGLHADRLYRYRVRAFNQNGLSAYTPVAAAPSSVPAAPTGLAAAAASSTSIRLTWTDASSSESGYQIERLTSDGTYQLRGTAPANATSFTQTGLNPKTAYSFRVRAVNAAGASDYSNVAAATTPP